MLYLAIFIMVSQEWYVLFLKRLKFETLEAEDLKPWLTDTEKDR